MDQLGKTEFERTEDGVVRVGAMRDRERWRLWSCGCDACRRFRVWRGSRIPAEFRERETERVRARV